jgi:hypothetical protein
MLSESLSVCTDTEATEFGKRPIFREVGTGEKITKEDYLKRTGGSQALPQTQEDLEKRYSQFTEAEDVYVLIDRGYFRKESLLMYEVVFSCFEGTSPSYLFPMFDSYLALLQKHQDKGFVSFIKRGLGQSLRGAANMLERSCEACGLTDKDLFLDVFTEWFGGIFSSSGSE